MKIRSKYSWYQYGEESANFFYGLEKKNAICGKMQLQKREQIMEKE